MSTLGPWDYELDDDGDPRLDARRFDGDGRDYPDVRAAVWPIYARGAAVVAIGWSVQLPDGSDGPEGRIEITHPNGWPWDAWRVALGTADAAARAAGWREP